MTESTLIPQEYYARQGMMTDPKEYAKLLDGLPTNIPSLCQVVQGLTVHTFWAERYGHKLSEERKQEVELRMVSRRLARTLELDGRPLTEARPLEKRLVGNCRDFSTLLCAILRHQGMPARARCGFGAYFLPNHYEDHWVCEYWKASEQRWVMVDAQLDAFQRDALQIQFDPLDVPNDQFLTGGRAWAMCRAGQADPDQFGIFDMHGMWFIRGDLGRDFLSLNKIEILPWDGWGLLYKDEAQVTEDDRAFLDRIAAMTIDSDKAFEQIRSVYENDTRFHIPPDWQPLTLDQARQLS
jgi:hypothetical protein